MTAAVAAMRTDLDERPGDGARRGGQLGGAAVTNLLSFVLFVVTRFISVGSVGLLAVGTTVVTLALVPAVLGLDTGSIRFVARAAASTTNARARRVPSRACRRGGLELVLAVVIFAEAPWIARAAQARSDRLLRLSASDCRAGDLGSLAPQARLRRDAVCSVVRGAAGGVESRPRRNAARRGPGSPWPGARGVGCGVRHVLRVGRRARADPPAGASAGADAGTPQRARFSLPQTLSGCSSSPSSGPTRCCSRATAAPTKWASLVAGRLRAGDRHLHCDRADVRASVSQLPTLGVRAMTSRGC